MSSVFKSKEKSGAVAKKASKSILTGICAAFAATIGTLVFTTPVAVLYFGYVSLIGILVNVLIFWAISVSFILGNISCILGVIWLPLGTVFGALTSLLVRYIIAVVKLAAAVPYGAIYTKGTLFGYWLILVYIIFSLCYVFAGKKRAFFPLYLFVLQ